MRTTTQTHALLFSEKSYGTLHYVTWVLRALYSARRGSHIAPSKLEVKIHTNASDRLYEQGVTPPPHTKTKPNHVLCIVWIKNKVMIYATAVHWPLHPNGRICSLANGRFTHDNNSKKRPRGSLQIKSLANGHGSSIPHVLMVFFGCFT